MFEVLFSGCFQFQKYLKVTQLLNGCTIIWVIFLIYHLQMHPIWTSLNLSHQNLYEQKKNVRSFVLRMFSISEAFESYTTSEWLYHHLGHLSDLSSANASNLDQPKLLSLKLI